MGHAVFNVRKAEIETYWVKASAASYADGAYEIVDDSNYYAVTDDFGHPMDGARELFASTFNAYLSHPDKFISMIEDNDTPGSAKYFGRRIFCYMRDVVFNGKAFCKNDPYAAIAEKGDRAILDGEELFNSLIPKFNDVKTPVNIKMGIYMAVSYLAEIDERYSGYNCTFKDGMGWDKMRLIKEEH
jgi:hypothetical protein